MGFTLWNLLKATLLVVNAFAVLHDKRFLKKHGLDGASGTDVGGIKYQLAHLFTAARYMRFPLLIVNSLVIIVELLFG